ncbi:MAG: hypothetical protein ABI833_16480 [Acidobacteriota bacterium]
MLRKLLLATLSIAAASVVAAQSATFGIRVPIGGEATDLAVDQSRGVLYIADFTASRIDRMNLATFQLEAPIQVDPNPASMSLSPDLRWLLVAHYDNPKTGTPTNNHLTLLDLVLGTRRTLALQDPPLAVSFGADDQAFVVTTREFLLYDPGANTAGSLGTIASLGPLVTPVPDATFPLDITTASISRSGDGMTIFGMGGSNDTITFRYDVATHHVTPGGIVLSNGSLGPRVVSLNQDGSVVMAGWIMLNHGKVTNFVPQSTNQFSVGTSLIDDSRGLIYAQIPATLGEPPVLLVLAEDNLTVVQKLRLPENTTGKSTFNPQSSVMYSISQSGVLVLPVGYLASMSRVTTSAASLLFRGNFCDNSTISRTLTVTDPGGLLGSPFIFKPATPGVTVSPSFGFTPATVTVTVDPSAFAALHGTEAIDLGLSSPTAINVIDPVRVLVNHADPNQRGTILEVPGTLVDLLADSARDRYYVLRQDNNTLLAFDGANNTLLKTLRTNNVPTSMAISLDNQYLYIGHDASQTLAVYRLDDYARQPDVATGAGNGNVVRSLAVTNNRIIATSRDYKGRGHILLFDPVTLTATQPDAVGVWENEISVGSVAVANPFGSQAMVVTPDGYTFLYDAGVGDFTVSNKNFSALTGPYATTPGLYAVDAHLLNGSLVSFLDLEATSGRFSGLVFSAGVVRTGAVASTSPGFAERVNFATGGAILPTLTVEAPLLPNPASTMSDFIRSLAVLPFHGSFVSLSQSGLTLLAADYDAPLPQPLISSLTSAADGTSGVASGGLISISGSNLSTSPVASSTTPLPTVLANSCVTVNGAPISLLMVSPSLINAQLDNSTGGPAVMYIRTPQNVSPAFNFNVRANAPAVFLNGQAGESSNLPAVYRAANGLLVTGTNPVRRNDSLNIYAAGLGLTSPVVPAGTVSPANPLATATLQPTVTLNGVGLPVTFAGLASGQIGVYQISVNVPNSTPLGLSVPLTITQGGQSQTVNVRVVN